jgi:Rod binding domain-containing protein
MNTGRIQPQGFESLNQAGRQHAKTLRPLVPTDNIPGAKTQPAPHAPRGTQSEKLVASTFYGQLLKQMRQSPFKSDLIDGGRAGQAYSSLFDQHLAEHMARGSKLVNSIVRHIERRGGVTPPSAENENPFKNVRISVAPGLGN